MDLAPPVVRCGLIVPSKFVLVLPSIDCNWFAILPNFNLLTKLPLPFRVSFFRFDPWYVVRPRELKLRFTH